MSPEQRKALPLAAILAGQGPVGIVGLVVLIVALAYVVRR